MKRKGRLLLILAALALWVYLGMPGTDPVIARLRSEKLNRTPLPGWVQEELIEIDGTSRQGEKLEGIRNIVIHYVGNPGTTALQNRNWYANPESEVSSHFLVGLDGEVLLCVPLDERSSASNHRNADTISIEVCHPDASGKFSDSTYDALVTLTAWLLDSCCLDARTVIRHYDITGKECPRYFVEHEESWEAFRADVARAARKKG